MADTKAAGTADKEVQCRVTDIYQPPSRCKG